MALPPISSTPVPAQRPMSEARAAAQRAFFEAALGRAAAAPAPAPSAQTAAAAATGPRAAAAPRSPPPAQAARAGEPPRAYDPTLRPGSIVDIRV